MLSKGKQEEFLKAEIQQIRLAIAHFKKTKPARKPIHALRVSMKKIKSLAELSSFYDPDANIYTDELKSIFKLAGEIRNGRIITDLMSRYRINDKTLRRYQKSAESNAVTRFFVKRGHFLMHLDRFPQSIRHDLRAIPDNTVLDFCSIQLDQIRRFFAHSPDLRLLHECRKRIKHLIYLQELLSPRQVKSISLDTNFMDQLQDLIGRWHNHVMLLELLHEFNAADSRQLKNIEKRSKVLLSQIEKLWHSSMSTMQSSADADQQKQKNRKIKKHLPPSKRLRPFITNSLH